MTLPESLELLPCPFCGGDNIQRSGERAHADWYWIVCDDCGAGFEEVYPDQKAADEKWNHRAALSHQSKAPEREPEPDCWAILTANGSKLVSPDEAKGRRDAYPLYTNPPDLENAFADGRRYEREQTAALAEREAPPQPRQEDGAQSERELPPLPEPEFSMAYFHYEGWNDWDASALAGLRDDGIGTRTAYSAEQMKAYALRALSQPAAQSEQP